MSSKKNQYITDYLDITGLGKSARIGGTAEGRLGLR
jgi:hypothetical protein